MMATKWCFLPLAIGQNTSRFKIASLYELYKVIKPKKNRLKEVKIHKMYGPRSRIDFDLSKQFHTVE